VQGRDSKGDEGPLKKRNPLQIGGLVQNRPEHGPLSREGLGSGRETTSPKRKKDSDGLTGMELGEGFSPRRSAWYGKRKARTSQNPVMRPEKLA
jgi:hypothetical protein